MELTFIAREFFAVAYLLAGLSHLLQPRLWADLFRTILERPYGPIIIAQYTGPLALLLVLTHNVWVWDLPLIVTLVAWAMLIKSVVYLLWPGVKSRIAPERSRGPRQYVIAGIVCLLIGALVGIDVALDLAAAR